MAEKIQTGISIKISTMERARRYIEALEQHPLLEKPSFSSLTDMALTYFLEHAERQLAVQSPPGQV